MEFTLDEYVNCVLGKIFGFKSINLTSHTTIRKRSHTNVRRVRFRCQQNLIIRNVLSEVAFLQTKEQSNHKAEHTAHF